MAVYRASQKDATRLYAREATFVQSPEGPGLLSIALTKMDTGVGL